MEHLFKHQKQEPITQVRHGPVGTGFGLARQERRAVRSGPPEVELRLQRRGAVADSPYGARLGAWG